MDIFMAKNRSPCLSFPSHCCFCVHLAHRLLDQVLVFERATSPQLPSCLSTTLLPPHLAAALEGVCPHKAGPTARNTKRSREPDAALTDRDGLQRVHQLESRWETRWIKPSPQPPLAVSRQQKLLRSRRRCPHWLVARSSPSSPQRAAP